MYSGFLVFPDFDKKQEVSISYRRMETTRGDGILRQEIPSSFSERQNRRFHPPLVKGKTGDSILL
ncbi:MAG: hypothetical protein R6U62_01705 [Bacteroidales bacterium]